MARRPKGNCVAYVNSRASSVIVLQDEIKEEEHDDECNYNISNGRLQAAKNVNT